MIRIVRNLLANAVDFAEDRPIEVRVAANRKAVAISVRDYGVGIDETKSLMYSIDSGEATLHVRAYRRHRIGLGHRHD